MIDAIDGIGGFVRPGITIGVFGEEGSGKSSLALHLAATQTESRTVYYINIDGHAFVSSFLRAHPTIHQLTVDDVVHNNTNMEADSLVVIDGTNSFLGNTNRRAYEAIPEAVMLLRVLARMSQVCMMALVTSTPFGANNAKTVFLETEPLIDVGVAVTPASGRTRRQDNGEYDRGKGRAILFKPGRKTYTIPAFDFSKYEPRYMPEHFR